MNPDLQQAALRLLDIIMTAGGLTASLSIFLLFAQRIAIKMSIEQAGFRSIYFTAWFSVPVHEASHALVALIFRHNIREIVLFSPEPKTGVLGYVSHQYQQTPYQIIGCFFIGIAPLFGGVTALYLLNALFFPEVNDVLRQIPETQSDGLSEYLSYLLFFGEQSIEDLFFVFDNFSWKHIAWLYFSCGIALHMAPSNQDMKNSLYGMLFLLALVTIFMLISPSLAVYMSEVIKEQLLFVTRLLVLAFYLTLLPLLLLWLTGQIKASIKTLKTP